MALSERKSIRLRGYDYSNPGAYFVTVCTQKRQCLFPFAVGAAPCGRPNPAREIAEEWLEKLTDKYPGVLLEKYVVMPNHIHLLLRFVSWEEAGGHMGPPLQEVLDWYKTMTTNAYIRAVKSGRLPCFQGRIWQRGYYEHVIRNERDYLEIWRYIDQNPARWNEDEYYAETAGGAP